MNPRTEAILAVVSAILVLLSAMWDARISAGIAIVALASLATYQLLRAKR